MGKLYLIQGGFKKRMTQIPIDKYTILGEMDEITVEDVRKIAASLGLLDIDENELLAGTREEAKEHPDIVGSDTEKAVRIAAAHLKEVPDYYTRLKAIEGETVEKGGPGSGRYPAGSGKGKKPSKEAIEEHERKRIEGLSNKEYYREMGREPTIPSLRRELANKFAKQEPIAVEGQAVEKGGPGSGRRPGGGSKYKTIRERLRRMRNESKDWYSRHGTNYTGQFAFPKNINKQEPIASDEPVISQGAIVSKDGHTGKVLKVEGDFAYVSWEDAATSKVPVKDLKYEGRVEKGGPGSGRRPEAGFNARKDKAVYNPKQLSRYKELRTKGATHREAHLVVTRPREYSYGKD